jgi:uncharacterized protein (TIGR00369 family)
MTAAGESPGDDRAERAASYLDAWNQGLLSDIGPPIHALMGIRVISLIPICVVELEGNDLLRGMPAGSIHGGLLATLFDVACAISLWESFDSAVEHPATTDLHVRYFRQPSTWPVRCEVEVAHAGRRMLSTTAVATDGEGRTLATGSASFALITRKW